MNYSESILPLVNRFVTYIQDRDAQRYSKLVDVFPVYRALKKREPLEQQFLTVLQELNRSLNRFGKFPSQRVCDDVDSLERVRGMLRSIGAAAQAHFNDTDLPGNVKKEIKALAANTRRCESLIQRKQDALNELLRFRI